MGMIMKYDGHRVVVFPNNSNVITIGIKETKGERIHRIQTERCKKLKHLICHLDGVLEVRIEHNQIGVCTFCGYGWETEEDGKPMCCQKAIEEWEQKKPK